jgi:hypothetical protein
VRQTSSPSIPDPRGSSPDVERESTTATEHLASELREAVAAAVASDDAPPASTPPPPERDLRRESGTRRSITDEEIERYRARLRETLAPPDDERS